MNTITCCFIYENNRLYTFQNIYNDQTSNRIYENIIKAHSRKCNITTYRENVESKFLGSICSMRRNENSRYNEKLNTNICRMHKKRSRR